MLTNLQARTAQAIVNVFETSRVLGDYAKVTLIPGDSGGLTYGRSQTTLNSGGLHTLIGDYCRAPGALFADRLRPFLDALGAKDPVLESDGHFKNLLRAAADDGSMRATQDTFFDREYWQPAVRAAARDGISSALGTAVVYDSFVHGSWGFIRGRTNHRGTAAEIGESAWIAAYVAERRDWLAGHRRADLRKTVYRMESFQGLIDQEDWDLPLPLVVRDAEIDEVSLNATPGGVYTGPELRSRLIRLTQPIARGLDVRQVQLALSSPRAGAAVVADGLFGRQSSQAVRAFQERVGLPPTGELDEATLIALGL